MSRIAILVIVIVLILGGLFFLSTLAQEEPTRTIETEVSQGANAS